jgi:hypothetical protein
LHKDTITDMMFNYFNQECFLMTSSLDQTVHLYRYKSDKAVEIAYIGTS